MIFGPIPVAEAEGALLAHSLVLADGKLSKGRQVTADDVARLKDAGIHTITVARLEPGDLSEDKAASLIGECLLADGLRLGPVFTGRVNLIAQTAGVVTIDAERIVGLNAIHEGLTLATLPDMMRVAADQLVATAKIIPYGLPGDVVAAGVAALGEGPIALHPFRGGRAHLVMTRTPGFKDSLLAKGEVTIRNRIEALGFDLGVVTTVAHEETEVARALEAEAADLHLILGASATSDRADVAPQAVVRAGGRIDRFGMPVDPGNLLFLGDLKGSPVVGLPGCARSPALNGVDWVLERLSAGLPVNGEAIASMGVGGLLKEMQGRPQPRRPKGAV